MAISERMPPGIPPEPFARRSPCVNATRAPPRAPRLGRVDLASSCLALTWNVHVAGDGARDLLPPRSFGRELLLSGGGQTVDTHALPVFRDVPIGSDPALFLEPVECGV